MLIISLYKSSNMGIKFMMDKCSNGWFLYYVMILPHLNKSHDILFPVLFSVHFSTLLYLGKEESEL